MTCLPAAANLRALMQVVEAFRSSSTCRRCASVRGANAADPAAG